jgi:glycosyltransferase involved in cell wall biosynthesis
VRPLPSNDKIHLVQVVWDLSAVGGAERSVVMIAKGIDRSAYDISVISICGKGCNGKEIEEIGIPVVALNSNPARAFNPLITLRLWEYFRSLKPDIVHSHLNYNALVATRLARSPILVRHEHNVYPDRTSTMALADKITDQWVHRIVACSESVKQATQSREAIESDKVTVIRWGIDTKEMVAHRSAHDVRASLGIADDDEVLVCVASLTEKKGHEYLLRSFPQIQSLFTQTRLVLVGDGPRRPYLESLVRRLRIESKVTLLGIRSDISDLLNMSDLFVLPSLYEGTPIAIMEAQAMGVPCVTTRVGGTDELILHNKTGLLVEPRSAEALASAVCQLLANPQRRLRMSHTARRYARCHFSTERFFRELDALYRQLLVEKRAC